VHLVGFTVEIYHDARPYKRQIRSRIFVRQTIVGLISSKESTCGAVEAER
jgi:hypothetical protein